MIQDLKARLGGDKSFAASLEPLRGQTVRGGDVGGCGFRLLVAGLLKAHELEVIGLTLQLYDHGAGCRECAQLLCRTRHPRCASGCRFFGYSALCSGLPEGFSRIRD